MNSPWEDLCIVHLDTFDRPDNRRLHPDEATKPTPLAPWRTWLCQRYVACRTVAAFEAAMKASDGPTFVVLHLSDLKSANEAFDLPSWLRTTNGESRPSRLLLLYSMSWWVWPQCEPSEVIAEVGDLLPAELCPSHWTAFPFVTDLNGPPRPCAWLGQMTSTARLPTIARPFADWRDTLTRNDIGLDLLGDVEPAALAALVERVRRSLLAEWFDTEHSRTDRPAEKRRSKMLRFGDDLWLLEGVAADRGWSRLQSLAIGVRHQLETFLGRCCSAADLRPEGKPSWQPTITAIESVLREYR